MFNVAVFKLSDILKYFVGFIICVSIIIISAKYFFVNREKDKIDNVKVKIEGISVR